LTVAAAEAAIGLAILVVYFRNRGSIEVDDINLMRG
jgi:NADH-quinone oxidoreductase subunit K